MRNQYKLNCYRKGRCEIQHPLDSTKWLSETLILSVWTVSKKQYYIVAESLRTGFFCALRTRTLLEATVRLREMCDLLQPPRFFNWETENRKIYENATPCDLKSRLNSRKTQRLPMSEGLLRYSHENGEPTIFMLVALGHPDECPKK